MYASSTRSVPKVTLVPLEISGGQPQGGRALLKSGFVRHLLLQQGEVASTLRSHPDLRSDTGDSHSGLNVLGRLEGAPISLEFPLPAVISKIPTSDLLTFGKSLIKIRQQRLRQLEDQHAAAGSQAVDVEKSTAASVTPSDLGRQTHLVNLATGAVNAFTANSTVSPLGMLNLERLDMTPAGIEKGELLATIPLAPREKTSVVQQEWSVIDEEFTTIVTDSLENFSQTGVRENTELAQATTSQIAHSNRLNVTASASGGCGFVSGSASTTFGTQGPDSQSATDSRKHAITTTRLASSRMKQSRKVSISTSPVTGSSESTTRTLENPSATDVMRIDYFSMMRKWHVGLYRYGLRLTYDITVPEPGAAMRVDFKELEALRIRANTPFVFDFPVDDISETDGPNNYKTLAAQWGAQIPSPPLPPTRFDTINQTITKGADGSGDIFANQVSMPLQGGYEVVSISLDLELSGFKISPKGRRSDVVESTNGRRFDVVGSSTNTWFQPDWPIATRRFDLLGPVDSSNKASPFLAGARDNITITFMTGAFGNGTAVFYIIQKRTDEVMSQWRASVWSALYDAAQTKYFADQAKIRARKTELEAKISGVDTLTLRREEHDEILKCALRWILGPKFEFIPQNVQDIFTAAAGKDPTKPTGDLTYGVNFTGNSIDPGNSIQNWSIMYQHGVIVNFINQAIEWENVVYFLYSYFWDISTSWEFIRNITHPDPTRQAFLRAGSARVVLTVRKGYERQWTWFAEHYSLGSPLDPPPFDGSDPYMTVADQIRNYDDTNYPGIPPANPDGDGPADDGTPQTATVCTSQVSPGATASTPVTIPVESSSKFVVGAVAVIDAWTSKIQERQKILNVPDGTHITVQGLLSGHDKSCGIYQAPSNGILIAEWFEYTPSKGTFIAVNSDLDSMV